MTSVLFGLWIIEGVLTFVAVVMFIRHGLIELREEDDLILSEAEANVAREQVAIQRKASSLERRIKQICIAWVAVMATIAVVWFLDQIY